MNNLFPETSSIIFALGWALVHALWQGMLVYTLLRLTLRFIPGNHASARYYTSVTALGVITAWFIATWLYQYNLSAGQMTLLENPKNITPNPAIPVVTDAHPDINVIDRMSAWYNTNTTAIVNIYLMGIALLTGRLLYNLFMLRRLKLDGIKEPPKQWTAILENSMKALTINKNVRLLLSEKVNVPMIMGTLKPIILIPVALANTLTIKEVEAILLHELAHVKRNDYLINIIQMFIETILFYNPFVWLISSIIRKEREHCCDDIVVMQTEDKLPYAKALAALETYRLYPAQPALAATGSKNQLLTRIKRIMEMKNNNINFGQLTAVLLIVILLLSSIALIVPEVNAQEKKDKKKKNPKKSTKTEIVIEQKDDKGSSSSSTSSSGNVIKKTIIISDDDDDITELEDDIEKVGLKTAIIAIETANKALAEIDLGGIITEALEGIEWETISEEIKDSLSKEDWDGVRKEVRIALHESNTAIKEAKKEMAEAKNKYSKDIAAAKKQLAEASKQMAEARKEMAEAQKQMAYAQKIEIKKQIEEFSSDENVYIRRNGKKVPVDPSARILATSSRDKLLKSLEKDGLIDRRNGFKIEKKKNELYIDGIKQSKEVIKKYDELLGDGNFTIKGNYRSIKISTDN